MNEFSEKESLSAKIKKHKYVWLLYILIAIGLNILVLLIGGCLAPLLTALVTFGIPYLFGVRSAKTFLIAGTAILIVSAICLAAVYTHYAYTEFREVDVIPKKDDGPKIISYGVIPEVGSKDDKFYFVVTCTGNASNPPVMFLNLTDDINALREEDQKWYDVTNNTNFKSDIWSKYHLWFVRLSGTYDADRNHWVYNYTTTLPEGNYYYYFSGYIRIGENVTWSNTYVKHGPINIERWNYFGFMTMIALIGVLIMVGLIYYIIVALFWWIKKAKEEREKLLEEVEREELKGKLKKTEYTCSSCGAVVKEEDKVCPKCGEKFEGEEEEESKKW
jgi:uncharacterized membrane protein